MQLTTKELRAVGKCRFDDKWGKTYGVIALIFMVPLISIASVILAAHSHINGTDLSRDWLVTRTVLFTLFAVTITGVLITLYTYIVLSNNFEKKFEKENTTVKITDTEGHPIEK